MGEHEHEEELAHVASTGAISRKFIYPGKPHLLRLIVGAVSVSPTDCMMIRQRGNAIVTAKITRCKGISLPNTSSVQIRHREVEITVEKRIAWVETS